MLLTVLCSVSLAVPDGLPEADGGESLPLAVSWNQGLRFESADGSVRLRLRSRLHVDGFKAGADNDLESALGRFEEEAEVRRARLGLQGTLGPRLGFLAQYEFAGEEVEFRSIYLSLDDVGVADQLRIGQMKEPLGFEAQASTNHIDFLERGLASQLAPGRNVGATLQGQVGDQACHWSLGAFREDDGQGRSTGSEWATTGRLWCQPLEGDGRTLHLGVGLSLRDPVDGEVQVRARPEAHLAPVLVDTGTVADVDQVRLLGLEAAWIQGPWSIASESIHSRWRRSGADARLHGWSVQTAWTLTGESRAYRADPGTFGGISPDRPWDPRQGTFGAWQLVARWSDLDLNGGGVRGGRLQDLSLGVIGTLTDELRVMADVVRVHRVGVGRATMGLVRVQFAF